MVMLLLLYKQFKRTRRQPTARLIQEYEEQLLHSSGSKRSGSDDHGQSLAAKSSKSGMSKGSRQGKVDNRRFYRCHKRGHIARYCLLRNRRIGQEGYDENGYQNKDSSSPSAKTAELLMGHDDTSQGTYVKCLSEFDHNMSKSCAVQNHEMEPHNNSTFKCFDSSLDPYDGHEGHEQATVVISSDASKGDDAFLLDSGASDHMVRRRDWLQDIREIEPRGIILGDGKE